MITVVTTIALYLCVGAQVANERSDPSSNQGGQPNLISEPGFENGGAAWQKVHNGGRGLVASPVHGGSAALQIQFDSQFSREVFQDVSISPGTTYETGGWLKTSNVDGRGADISVRWMDDTGATVRVDTIGVMSGTQDWTFLAGGFTAPPTAQKARVQLAGDTDPDGVATAWFDDIVLLGAPGTPDPSVGFATYVGGSRDDVVRDIAFDRHGNVILVGATLSTDFPVTPGAYDTSLDTSGVEIRDVVVMKLGPNGTVQWSTLIGGPEYDRAYSVEVDAQGYVYIAGRAGPGYPTTTGVIQPTFAGDFNPNSRYGVQDGFISKLSPDGSQLIWSTYFGTDDRSFIRDMDIDDDGNVYIVLTAVSRDVSHVTAGAFQTVRGGRTDGVVAKISPDGTRVLWASYLGGSELDVGTPSLRVDALGQAHVLGFTNSNDIATTPGAYDRTYNGGNGDVHLAKFSADGTRLIFGTYLGGSGIEFTETHGLALDDAGNVIVAATTTSTDLPTTPGALQRSYGGTGGSGTGQFTNYPGDGFIAKLSPDGSTLLASTYLGGRFGEGIEGVMVDAAGNIYASGSTYSDDFPVTATAFQSSIAGDADFFAATLLPDLSLISYATYFGGRGTDFCRASAADDFGNFYVAGHSTSDNFPVVQAFQPNWGGNRDGIVILIHTGSADCSVGDDTPCNDFDPCTMRDVCNGGVCAGTDIDCSLLNSACHSGACNAATGLCESIAFTDGTPCEDIGDLCKSGGIYNSGACVNETVMDCADNVACTTDRCHLGECVHTPLSSLCVDDGVFCNGMESCDPVLGCVSPGNPCIDPLNCDEQNNTCGCEAPVVMAEGPRYLAVSPPTTHVPVALRVSGVNPEVACVSGFIQSDGRLGDNPFYFSPTGNPARTIHVHDVALLAGNTYQVVADCNAISPGAELSPVSTATLWSWGDVDHDNTVDIVDISRVVDVFRGDLYDARTCIRDTDCAGIFPAAVCDNSIGLCVRITLQNTDLVGVAGCEPDGVIDIMDLANCIDAFRGSANPCTPSCP